MRSQLCNFAGSGTGKVLRFISKKGNNSQIYLVEEKPNLLLALYCPELMWRMMNFCLPAMPAQTLATPDWMNLDYLRFDSAE
ncbi:hypothetical protein [Vibrio hangzhouensis]|uniref:Uncharacterized protein n=1 Tax=Vibrio hangzhouensis TaxID=462991 RepID=A0A1H6AFE9_9VIBR|nr:hypothetical protein [Vibrio hangzhouensis]SEG46745.1 hypothetical protein SAMN04488244_11526 [Vibrio hangzhouensis]